MIQRNHLKPLLILGTALVIGLCLYAAAFFGEKAPILAAGQIRLAEHLTPKAQGTRTLFITLFDSDSPSPMPYGAFRAALSTDAQGDFYAFMLTKDNVQIMNENSSLPNHLTLKARLDKDGQGGPDQSGDLTGKVDAVPLGAQSILIEVNHEVP